MGKQLNEADFDDLVGIVDDEPPAPTERAGEGAISPVSIEPSPQPQRNAAERAVIQKAAQSRPSPYQADLRAKLREKKQFQLGLIPEFVADAFSDFAKKNGMTKREYLYYLLRKEGADIPPYSQMDGRTL